jgi:hypothetical protein
VSGAARSHARSRRAPGNTPRLACALALPLLLGACSFNGDFGRLKPEYYGDDLHDWVGRDAARAANRPISNYPLTDEERLLRDLAFPFIEPPYERNTWFQIINEYGVSNAMSSLAREHGIGNAFRWPGFEVSGYGTRLLAEPYRSATARYNQLNTDIRNDTVRVPPFFAVARRVLDLADKRVTSLAYVSALQRKEQANALARVAENRLVVAWAQRAVVEREQAYCWALQRLVIATPAPMAVEAERSLTLLNSRIGENRVLVGGEFGPTPPGCGAAPPVGIVTK